MHQLYTPVPPPDGLLTPEGGITRPARWVPRRRFDPSFLAISLGFLDISAGLVSLLGGATGAGAGITLGFGVLKKHIYSCSSWMLVSVLTTAIQPCLYLIVSNVSFLSGIRSGYTCFNHKISSLLTGGKSSVA